MPGESYLNTLLLVYAFVWGAIWGSFLNVVIWRLPRRQNLSRPPSHCPSCETPIAWYDNVPLVSWLVLRGRCRACRTSISVRYPLVELLVAVLSTLLWWHVSRLAPASAPLQVMAVPFLLHFVFMLLLVSIAFIDLDLTIIPHRLTFPAMAWGVIGALLLPKAEGWQHYFPAVDIVDSVLGLALGAGIIALIIVSYRAIRGHDGMGWGDATLLAAIGANLGMASLLFVILFASFQGVIAALVFAAIDRARGVTSGGEGSALIRGAHTDEYWEQHPLAHLYDGDQAAEQGAQANDDPARPAGDATAAAADAPSTGDADDDGFLMQGLPFGPFLALAAIEYIPVGRLFVGWLTAGLYP